MEADEFSFKEKWPKKCGSCGMQYDEESWEKLHYVGVQHGVDEIPDLELRNCAACRSTMAQPVPNDIVAAHPRVKSQSSIDDDFSI